MKEEELFQAIRQICIRSGEGEDFAKAFFEELKEEEEICEEFVCYLESGTFACRAKAAGYTVVDVMIWQMDHFKAWLDRDNSKTKHSKEGMVLRAFATFLKMKKNPAPYSRKMQEETGTDYPDKYS